MLSEKQVLELREHLARAQNPIFYYDNDCDGLCSFVLLRRFLGRGKGVSVRSFPDLNKDYARKARELNADYVFVLDKPVLSQEFVEAISNMGLPLVWIDHHDLPVQDFEKEFDNLSVYNPTRNKGMTKSNEPVTYLAYIISGREEDVWIAVMGCIADHYLPDFVSVFEKRYPEMWGDFNGAFDAYYGSEIGRIARALNFGLKDSITHVVQLQNFLISCQHPREVLSEVPGNYSFRKKYIGVEQKCDGFVKKAASKLHNNIIFFSYSGDLSISSDISNVLSYRYRDAYIAVAYINGNIVNISLRGKDVRLILERVLLLVPGSGGGHDDAVGARVGASDLARFQEVFEQEVARYRGKRSD